MLPFLYTNTTVTVHMQELLLLSDQVSRIISRGEEMHTAISTWKAVHVTHALKPGINVRKARLTDKTHKE